LFARALRYIGAALRGLETKDIYGQHVKSRELDDLTGRIEAIDERLESRR